MVNLKVFVSCFLGFSLKRIGMLVGSKGIQMKLKLIVFLNILIKINKIFLQYEVGYSFYSVVVKDYILLKSIFVLKYLFFF